jgi:hypothetical protein
MVSFVDLSTLKPNFIEMKNVAWVSSEDRMAGKIIFPSDFDETLDVEFATNELVSMLFIFFIYCKLCSNKKAKYFAASTISGYLNICRYSQRVGHNHNTPASPENCTLFENVYHRQVL